MGLGGGDGAGFGNEGGEADLRPGSGCIAFWGGRVSPADADIKLLFGGIDRTDCVGSLKLVLGVGALGELGDERCGDSESLFSSNGEVVKTRGLHDVKLAGGKVDRSGAHLRLETDFIGKDSHATKGEDTDQEDVHGHSGF